MTANELLALLGRAWPRLLVYPGGLAAFALIAVGRNDESRRRRDADRETTDETTDERRRTRDDGRETTDDRPGGRCSAVGVLVDPLEISAIVLPWLGLALLPLPYVAGISRQTDAIAVLALLEWPLVLTIAAELRAADAVGAPRAVRRLVAALWTGFPPLDPRRRCLVLALGAGSARAYS